MALRPINIATRYTVEFISRFAPQSSDILEIGCGDGDVAQTLTTTGFTVTAIDGDEKSVAAARDKGVNAVQAAWPEYQTSQMDVILFTRSLHHMHSLGNAVAAAHQHLRNGGLLLAEDFAFDHMDGSTVGWFMTALRSTTIGNMLTPPPDSFIAHLLGSKTPTKTWRQDHDHELHSIEAMESAISNAFGFSETHNAPYLYRYLIPALPADELAARALTNFFQMEQDAIAARRITPIGRRIAASNKTLEA